MSKPPKILLVDDDPILLQMLTIHLKAEGYQILTASDGGQALTTIERENPDLILLDLMMPRVDGMTVCAQVREYSLVPIIIVSAIGHEEQKVKALDLGADDYLTKPYGKDELRARIRTALRRAETGKKAPPNAVVKYGNFKIDFLRRHAARTGQNSRGCCRAWRTSSAGLGASLPRQRALFTHPHWQIAQEALRCEGYRDRHTLRRRLPLSHSELISSSFSSPPIDASHKSLEIL
jgi:CheY-like chemotaxis protein